MPRTIALVFLVTSIVQNVLIAAPQQETPESNAATNASSDEPLPEQEKEKPLPALPKQLNSIIAAATPMNPEQTIFLDLLGKRLYLRSQIVCKDCTLEMLCCQERTKEHESIFSFRGEAKVVHAGLLAIGAKAGKPVSFQPEFTPPSGDQIDIFVRWVDDKGKPQRVDVRKWLRHSTHRYFVYKMESPPPNIKFPISELRYDPYNKEILWFGPMTKEQRKEVLALSDDKSYRKAIDYFFDQGKSRAMDADFVFAGSFHYDQDLGDGKTAKRYAADSGFLICVANFGESLIDVRENSSSSDGGQSYEGWSERIPAEGTQLLLELVPAEQSASKSKSMPPNSPADKQDER